MGTDLSQIQPLSWMPNCQFVQENSELQDWTFSCKFDYIHLRGTLGCFNSTVRVVQKAYDGLQKGGWIELQDAGFDIWGLNDNSGFQQSHLKRWWHLVQSGASSLGRDLTKARLYQRQLKDAGFVDVVEKVCEVPGGPWPESGKDKLIGVCTANAFCASMGVVDAFKPFLVAAQGVSEAEGVKLIALVKQEIQVAKFPWLTSLLVVPAGISNASVRADTML